MLGMNFNPSLNELSRLTFLISILCLSAEARGMVCSAISSTKAHNTPNLQSVDDDEQTSTPIHRRDDIEHLKVNGGGVCELGV